MGTTRRGPVERADRQPNQQFLGRSFPHARLSTVEHMHGYPISHVVLPFCGRDGKRSIAGLVDSADVFGMTFLIACSEGAWFQ